MKIFYAWDIKTRIYAGSVGCNKDINASAKAHKDVYNNPPNSTDIEPLPYKESNEIVWKGGKWVYQLMK